MHWMGVQDMHPIEWVECTRLGVRNVHPVQWAIYAPQTSPNLAQPHPRITLVGPLHPLWWLLGD